MLKILIQIHLFTPHSINLNLVWSRKNAIKFKKSLNNKSKSHHSQQDRIKWKIGSERTSHVPSRKKKKKR